MGDAAEYAADVRRLPDGWPEPEEPAVRKWLERQKSGDFSHPRLTELLDRARTLSRFGYSEIGEDVFGYLADRVSDLENRVRRLEDARTEVLRAIGVDLQVSTPKSKASHSHFALVAGQLRAALEDYQTMLRGADE